MSEHFKRGRFFKTEDTATPKIGYFLYEGQHSWLVTLMAAVCQRRDESRRLLTCSAAQKQHLRRPDFIIKFYFKRSASVLVFSSDCCHWDIMVHIFLKLMASGPAAVTVLEVTKCISSLPSKTKMALASTPLCYTSKRYCSLTADPKCSLLLTRKCGFHFIGSFFHNTFRCHDQALKTVNTDFHELP